MALRYMLRYVPKPVRVCNKWSTYNSELTKLASAVGNRNFCHSLAGYPSFDNNLSCNHNTQPLLTVYTRSFAVSSVKKNVEKHHGGDHTKLWSAERLLSTGLLGIIPAAIIFPSQPMDCLLALSLVMHSHWGIEAIVVDYVRPIIFGKTIPLIGQGLVYILSIATLTGLLFLIFNDCGLANAIHLLWKL